MVDEQKNLNEPNWAAFESKATGDFLKLGDGETKLIGIKSISQETAVFDRKQKDGTIKPTPVPQLHLHLDFVEKPLDKPMIFPTGAGYLVNTIREYHTSGMLYTWLFKLQRSGMDLKTKYTLIPVKQKPKSEQIEAFV